jgi:Na+/phosphate symporter
MSAGLPLLILSVLSTIILAVWLRNGAGDKTHRITAASVLLVILILSWVVLLSFGVFHPIGSWAMGVSFIASIVAFFVPLVYNKWCSNERT